MEKTRPAWLKATYNSKIIDNMNVVFSELDLNTVCKEADCPNIGECFKRNTATFMIMGNICTRHCRFCSVSKGIVQPLDPQEPEHLVVAAKKMGLKHIVITSVTRDDLSDGGAAHFAETILAAKRALPDATVEVLIPDMKGDRENLKKIVEAKPDVIGHNIETVPSLYAKVRPEAGYHTSLHVLEFIKKEAPDIITKAGIMVGLGEEEEEVCTVMDDLVEISCDILTIGQYLRPSDRHIPVEEYVTPEKFARYKKIGEEKGLRFVASGPLVRSSFRAAEAIKAIRGTIKT